MLGEWLSALTVRDRYGARPAFLSLLLLGLLSACSLSQSPAMPAKWISQPHPRNTSESTTAAADELQVEQIPYRAADGSTSPAPLAPATSQGTKIVQASDAIPASVTSPQVSNLPMEPMASETVTTQQIATQQIATQQIATRDTSSLPRMPVRSMPAVEPPPGWNAVEKRIREQLESCDAMLRRGAIYSAKQTCWQALEELCRVLDLHRPEGKRVEALRRAMVAMREEEDFYRYSSLQQSQPDLISNLSWSHETPIIRDWLKQQATSPEDRGVEQISPLIAAQHYRSYARQQMVLACDHHPWAADLLYALGKTMEKQAWEDRSRSALIQQHAEIIYQAALETNPKQYLAATQLGYILLQLDRPQEAREILAYSVTGLPTSAGYQNLREACRRLNDQQGIAWSTNKWAELQARDPDSAIDIPFTEIDARQFAAISVQDAQVTRMATTQNLPESSATSQRLSQPSNTATPSPSNATRGWLPSTWR